MAYYVGFPAGAARPPAAPTSSQYVPRDAAVVAYANVHEIMTSELRQKLRRALPMQENGSSEFENQTGINIETDIDRVVACLYPDRAGATTPGAGMVLARGRFDEVKIEALMREHGAQVEDYNGKRLIVVDHDARGSATTRRAPRSHSFAVSFIEPASSRSAARR